MPDTDPSLIRTVIEGGVLMGPFLLCQKPKSATRSLSIITMKSRAIAAMLIATVLPPAVAESPVGGFEAQLMKHENSAEEITKPPAWPADERAGVAKDEIIILVKADGGVVVDGRRLTLEGLSALLKQGAELPEESKVKIRGDAKVSYQRIAEVIEACR